MTILPPEMRRVVARVLTRCVERCDDAHWDEMVLAAVEKWIDSKFPRANGEDLYLRHLRVRNAPGREASLRVRGLEGGREVIRRNKTAFAKPAPVTEL